MALKDWIGEAALISLSNKTTTAGATTGLAGWLASINWLGFAGFLLGIAGYLTNLYFQRRRDKREAAENKARIQAIEHSCRTDL